MSLAGSLVPAWNWAQPLSPALDHRPGVRPCEEKEPSPSRPTLELGSQLGGWVLALLQPPVQAELRALSCCLAPVE